MHGKPIRLLTGMAHNPPESWKSQIAPGCSGGGSTALRSMSTKQSKPKAENRKPSSWQQLKCCLRFSWPTNISSFRLTPSLHLLIFFFLRLSSAG